MRHLIHTIYKALIYSKIAILHKIFTFFFKFRLWLNNIAYGKNLKTFNAIPSLQINRNAKKVRFGNNVLFNAYTGHSWNSNNKILVKESAILTIGDNSGMNGCMLFCSVSIIIGNNVKIGGGTRIFDTDFHSLDYQKRRNIETDFSFAKCAPIIIEDDVFIGAGCFIGRGITIGSRSIIAAGSVVVRSIPADEVWGGNPAKFIKKITSVH